MYRLRALFGGERRRSCPGQYILGILNGRAMEQKERRGGAGDRRSLFDLFSLFSGFFCFVVFSLSFLFLFS